MMQVNKKAVCLAIGLMNEIGIMSYPVEHPFQKDFRLFITSSYVAAHNLKLLVLYFSKSMYEIMTSLLAGLFLTCRSAVSLKNLFSAVGSVFNSLTLPILISDEEKIKFLFAHFFLVPQKVF